jgi:hypothetical protein
MDSMRVDEADDPALLARMSVTNYTAIYLVI